MSTTLAIFCCGVVRWLVGKSAERAGEKAEESDVSARSLYPSGLIAAGGIVGLLGIAVKLMETQGWLPENSISWGTKLSFMGDHPVFANLFGVVMFGLLAFSLFYYARKPLEGEKR